jgi:amidase
MDKLGFSTAGDLAAAIRDREASSVEVVEAHLAQMVRHNRELNAVVTVDEGGTLARAKEADAALARGENWGALHGVPVTIKDTIETAGLWTTAGYLPLSDYTPERDATVVARLRASGAIILGKTNVPTLAGDGQTDNPVFGRSNNPWDLTRTPGGSTGGGAAAVAAGLSPLEIGSDMVGSVRQPAHYCGVYALKPTDHRVPMTGHIPPLPRAQRGVRHMVTIGPLARSVDDLELALRIIAGSDGLDLEIPPVSLEPGIEVRFENLRFVWTDDFSGLPVTRDTRAALEKFAGQLQSAGCAIEQRAPSGFDFLAAWEAHGEMRQAEIGSMMTPEAEAEQAASIGATGNAEDALLRGRASALHATMRQYSATLAKRDRLIAALEKFLTSCDALICPVSVGPAITHQKTGVPISVDGKEVPYWMALWGHCAPFNLTGHPAVVLPLARSANGLPIGVQVVGRLWGEIKLLAIARRLAEVIGPLEAPPGY